MVGITYLTYRLTYAILSLGSDPAKSSQDNDLRRTYQTLLTGTLLEPGENTQRTL